MRALMLAAGLGERLRPHTLKLAKPAIPFLNLPMMAFPLFYLESAGLRELVMNTHHLPRTVEDAARSLVGDRYPVSFSFEREQILGSGGGLALAAGQFSPGQDIVIFNADTVMMCRNPNVVVSLLERHHRSGALATLHLTAFPQGAKSFGGVYLTKDHRVMRFSKVALHQEDWTPYHFTGLMVVSTKLLQYLKPQPSNLLYDDLQPLIDQGAMVSGFVDTQVRWFETGNIQDYLGATEASLESLANSDSWNEPLSAVLNHFTPDWRTGLLKGAAGILLGPPTAQSSLSSDLKVRDFAVVHPMAQVAERLHLERVVLGPGAQTQPGEALKDSLVV